MSRTMTRQRGRQALRDSTIQTTAAHDALVAACARLDEVGLAPQTRYRLTIALRAMREADKALQEEYVKKLGGDR